jgi:hypothetical protein
MIPFRRLTSTAQAAKLAPAQAMQNVPTALKSVRELAI